MRILLGLVLLCLSVGFCSEAVAQNWGGGVDDDNLHYGFTFQYISSELKILKKADWLFLEHPQTVSLLNMLKLKITLILRQPKLTLNSKAVQTGRTRCLLA